MPSLIWDEIGSRNYETGLDRGVLYLPTGDGVPWNGLISIVESVDKELSSVYYDGMKINNLVTLGSFSAVMKAITYPDEFIEIEGLLEINDGVFVGDQNPQTFGLCYRTQIGNAVSGNSIGYKIHILYNVIAVPHQKSYVTLSDQPNLTEFEWDISAIPEEIPGFRPTAHIIINSIDIDPDLLANIEEILYGSVSSSANLISMSNLITLLRE